MQLTRKNTTKEKIRRRSGSLENIAVSAHVNYSCHRGFKFAAIMEGSMDRYTKVVLTVIAVALVVIAFQNSGVLPAYAQSGGQMKVQICDEYGYCARVSSDGKLLIDGGRR
jgi:hypothetical protein